MGRKGSLIFQMDKRFKSMRATGKSRYDEKPFAKLLDEASCKCKKSSNIRTQGTHSFETYKTYRKWCKNFLKWEKEKYPSVNFLDKINLDHVGEWLKESIAKNHSAYTIRTKASSVAKLLNCHTYDFGVKMPSKKGDREKIKRSRHEVAYDKHFSVDNNKEIVDFESASGLRRSELSRVTAEQIKQDENGDVYIDFESKKNWRTMTKGGRGRKSYIRKPYRDFVLNFKFKFTDQTEKLFEKIHAAMDVHSYRRTYAQERYKELINDMRADGMVIKDDYICRDGSGRRYNRKALEMVSSDLGHTRLDVVVKNYLD